MRGVRSLLLLVAVLAGLIGYIYFVESKKPESTGEGEPKAKAFAVAADKIDELRVRPRPAIARRSRRAPRLAADGTRRDQGRWAEVSAITSSLASLGSAHRRREAGRSQAAALPSRRSRSRSGRLATRPTRR
jgi:hypothetical protein